jgi:hypothetical protein
MRAHVGVVVLLALASAGGTALSQGAACAKSEFEAVVNAAGAALSDLKQQNLPVLQGKLRQLKDKRSWSNEEFQKQVDPLVRDETVAGFDKKSEELVARITGGGRSEAEPAPDCSVLTGFQADLKLLVETQQAKWTHMLGKVEQELAK